MNLDILLNAALNPLSVEKNCIFSAVLKHFDRRDMSTLQAPNKVMSSQCVRVYLSLYV